MRTGTMRDYDGPETDVTNRSRRPSKTETIGRESVILDRIRQIPEGFVRTYGDIYPSAPRLVGRVLATSSGDDLPWHRVVRSNGSVAKGATQLRLLRSEGVPLIGNRVDLRKARLPA